MDYSHDSRIVLTLDAGATYLKFSAIRGNRLLAGPFALPTHPADLDRCIANIIQGFRTVRELLPEPPVAISFAFPGPADYPSGIITNVGETLPAFEGEVPLGPILEDEFKLPVFINNDGDLFVYGEALAGLLPQVNRMLEEAGSPKRFRNLFGLTFGTGLGGGIVHNGELFLGDNSNAGEVWLLRNKLDPENNAEEGACIRAVRRVYAREAGIPEEEAPDPKDIFEIGMGRRDGSRASALEAFRQLGEVAGDVVAQALTLVDSLVVIGGGVSGAHPLFLPALVEAANARFERGGRYRRVVQEVFNLEEPDQVRVFLAGERHAVTAPGSGRRIQFDPLKRTGVGLTRLGTSEAVAVGAQAFALSRLPG
ncbi:MAG: ROK family protein [Bryobacterales bacterium]|nr:ROK family protein [Bryobacterales bacterium]